MGIQINVGDHSGGEHGSVFTPIPEDVRWQCHWARRKARTIASDIRSANRYFRSLSVGRTLTNLLGDGSIWVNYDPSITYFGYTYSNNDIWIGPMPFRIGKWTVLATIIHELAHINGAPGGSAVCLPTGTCHAAERAVLESGLGNRTEFTSGKDDPQTPYNPTISG